PGTVALRPEKIRLSTAATATSGDRSASGNAEDGDAEGNGDNRCRGTVSDLLYMGDVTVYKVDTPGGHKIEALLANSAAGRTQFFEIGDAVALNWPLAAGHFIAE